METEHSIQNYKLCWWILFVGTKLERKCWKNKLWQDSIQNYKISTQRKNVLQRTLKKIRFYFVTLITRQLDLIMGRMMMTFIWDSIHSYDTPMPVHQKLVCKHPVCYMCMYLLRFSFNTLILGYKIIKFIGYMFQ
jgi:hypothetical protein